MNTFNWTKISNNLADSTDWEYISSQIKLELKLDIDPAFSMYVFEEYLKLAHKKNNPCVKGAEFVSRTFNTKNLFFKTKNLDYETFDKLIKFINKQLMEVNKINKKYEIVKFYDYYNDDKKNVSNMSASMSSNVSNDVSNMSSNVSNMSAKKNDDILMTKRKLQNKLAQAKRRVKKGLGTKFNMEKVQAEYDVFMSSMSSMSANVSNMSANVSNMSANVSNDVSKCHGGDRGGDITYTVVKNKERKKEGCVTVSAMSANQKKKCQQKMSATTPTPITFFEKNNQEQQNSFNAREFMNILKRLDEVSNEYANKIINFENYSFKQLNVSLNILHQLVIFTQPIIKNDFGNVKIEKQFNKIFELLDENTTTPFIENATMQEKKEKKRQMLFEIKNEAKTNAKSSLCLIYHFLLKYYGKKKENGYNLDCPTYLDLQSYIADYGTLYLTRSEKIEQNIKNCQQRIELLKQQQLGQEDKTTEEVIELMFG